MFGGQKARFALFLQKKQRMQKTYLFAGASSAMANALLENLKNDRVIGISTKNGLSDGYFAAYQVAGYSKENLPEIDGPVDGLVYFPGTINLRPFARMSEADFLAEYQINALGAVNFIQKYLPNLKNAPGGGSIVLISTVAVSQGMPFHASISMAKGAIEGLAIALAAELAPSVRVNVVAPSLTKTPLAGKLLNSPEKLDAGDKRHPLRRTGDAADIANGIQFLLTEKSAWVTGQVLHIDGGLSSVRII